MSADSADFAVFADTNGGWEEPTPLGDPIALPPFPADAFPAWLREEVAALARFTQTPVDLAATVALAVLSAAAGGRAVVEVRGSWREPVNIFTVAAMESGARKSAVFAELTGPLLDAEQVMADQTKPQIRDAETQQKVAQRAAEKAALAAAGKHGAEGDQAMADALAAAQLAEAIVVPVLPHMIADDITTEAAASLLAEQGGRLAVLSAEGGIFSTLAGRYSGGVPSLEVFLKGHSGDMLRVDRKGRPHEYIRNPALTLGLCVQPDVLRTIARMPGFRSRGLLARILYSQPPNLVGSRQVGAEPVPEEVRETYASSVRSLVMTMADWTDPAVLTLMPGASELVLETERSTEPRLHPDTGDLAGIVDWGSKSVGAMVRIAGLLHLAAHLRDGWGRPVGDDTMAAAISVMGYFTSHARAAFDLMGLDPVLADARVLLRWLQRTPVSQFTKREMFTAVSRSRFGKVADLDAPLALLEEHGYIRRLPEPEHKGPGRPRLPTSYTRVSSPQKPQNPQNSEEPSSARPAGQEASPDPPLSASRATSLRPTHHPRTTPGLSAWPPEPSAPAPAA